MAWVVEAPKGNPSSWVLIPALQWPFIWWYTRPPRHQQLRCHNYYVSYLWKIRSATSSAAGSVAQGPLAMFLHGFFWAASGQVFGNRSVTLKSICCSQKICQPNLDCKRPMENLKRWRRNRGQQCAWLSRLLRSAWHLRVLIGAYSLADKKLEAHC